MPDGPLTRRVGLVDDGRGADGDSKRGAGSFKDGRRSELLSFVASQWQVQVPVI